MRQVVTGTITAALAFGGAQPAYSALTEYYDGTTWTEVADLATGVLRCVWLWYFYICILCRRSNTKCGGNNRRIYSSYNCKHRFKKDRSGTILQGKVLKGFGKQGTGAWASGGTMTKSILFCWIWNTNCSCIRNRNWCSRSNNKNRRV